MAPEHVVDYRAFDFHGVWERRRAVHRFDQALLDLAIQDMDLRRILEIGTGYGRLTPQLSTEGREYVGVDFDLDMLREARSAASSAGGSRPNRAWLAANAYHLPFSPASFSSVGMIRVHHHLAEPLLALQEVSRVLAPGGRAVISYNPWSRTRAFFHDAGVALGRTKRAQDRYLLFAGRGTVLVRETPLPHYVMAPAQFRRDLARAGLEVVRSFGGLETRAARALPFGVALPTSRTFPNAPVFSTCWTVAQKRGTLGELPAWAEVLACPRCGGGEMRYRPDRPPSEPCPTCGFTFQTNGELADARYVFSTGPPSVG
jgi:SAM-dependent methyltransferase